MFMFVFIIMFDCLDAVGVRHQLCREVDHSMRY